MDKFISRKLAVTLIYTALVAVVKATGMDVSDELLMTVAGVCAAYLAAQGWADAAESKAKGSTDENA